MQQRGNKANVCMNIAVTLLLLPLMKPDRVQHSGNRERPRHRQAPTGASCSVFSTATQRTYALARFMHPACWSLSGTDATSQRHAAVDGCNTCCAAKLLDELVELAGMFGGELHVDIARMQCTVPAKAPSNSAKRP